MKTENESRLKENKSEITFVFAVTVSSEHCVTWTITHVNTWQTQNQI